MRRVAIWWDEVSLGEYDVTSEGVSLGRDPSCQVAVAHESVSAHHCDLVLSAAGQVVVRDLDSSNGVRINGEPVREAVLRDGDVLNLGEVALLVRTDSEDFVMPVPTGAVGQDAPPAAPGPFTELWRRIPGAMLYPFRGETGAVILLVTVLKSGLALVPLMLGLLTFVLDLMIGFYLLTLWRSIIQTAIDSDEGSLELRTNTLDSDSHREFVVSVIGLVFVCFGPLMVMAWIPSLSVVWKAAGLGWATFSFPMGLLGICRLGTIAVVFPTVFLPSLLRSCAGYLTVAAGPALWLGGIHYAESVVTPITMNPTPPMRALMTAVFTPIELYLVFVWLRTLGLFYRCYRDRLGWE